MRKFSTTNIFEREHILDSLTKSRLVFGSEFGVIQTYDAPNSNIRALCGLVGERDLVLLNQPANEFDSLRVKNVLIATLMIEFMATHGSGQLEFLIYGERQGQIKLSNMLRDNFQITQEPIPRLFRHTAVRRLCEKFLDQLYKIEINPLNHSGWGTISVAQFKSKQEHGSRINPNVSRMQQVRDNKAIIINSFKSELRDLNIESLANSLDIQFELLANGVINITIPDFPLSSTTSDLDYEAIFYEVSRQSYYRIIGDQQLYQVLPEGYEIQLRLF